MVAGGLHLSDTVKIARALERLGVDGLHISAGNYASYARGYLIPPMAIPDEPLVHLAAGVKKALLPLQKYENLRTPKKY